jgi:hypothetical protein
LGIDLGEFDLMGSNRFTIFIEDQEPRASCALIDGSYERFVTAYHCVAHLAIGAGLESGEFGTESCRFSKAEVGHGKDYRGSSNDWNTGTIERVTGNVSMVGKSGIPSYIKQNAERDGCNSTETCVINNIEAWFGLCVTTRSGRYMMRGHGLNNHTKCIAFYRKTPIKIMTISQGRSS